MSSATAIATRNAAENAIASRVVRSITSTAYTDEEAREFKSSLIAAARHVPTRLGGGAHGHTFLLETQAEHRRRTRTTTDYIEATLPAELSYTGANTAAEIAQRKSDHAVREEQYHTQEGCRVGLLKKIVANVPDALIVQHHDPDSHYDDVEPRVLLATVMDAATPITAVDGRALTQARDRALTFDTDETLAIQFSKARKAIRDLQNKHSVATSEEELMMKWMVDLDGEKEFDDEVEEWKARADDQRTLANFIAYFAERDREVRRKIKGRPASGGYHGAANAAEAPEDFEARILQRLGAQMEAEVANLAAAVDASINNAAGEDAPAPPASAPRGRVTPVPATTTNNEMLTLLKAIDERLKKVESSGGGGRRRGGRRGNANGAGDNDGNGNGDGAADGERQPCRHCGLKHKNPDEKCWDLPENAADRPAWYQKKLDKKAGRE